MVTMKLCRITKLVWLVALVGCGKKGAVGTSDGAGDTGIDSGSAPQTPTDPPTDEPSDDTGGPADSGDEPDPDPSDAVGDSVSDAVSVRSMATWEWSAPLVEESIDHAGDVDVYRVEPIIGVQSFIAAQGASGLDLKLRVLDVEERIMGQVDVMPHRVGGTDPGIWLQARTGDPVFVEVSAVGDGAIGQYALHGMYVDEEDAEPNDVDIDAAERVADGTQLYRASDTLPASDQEFSGVMHAGGDIDLWVYDAPENSVVSWTMWETASLVFDPKITLYDSSMQPIAWSTNPSFADKGSWYSDVGILYPVVAGQRYYLEVTNERPPSGAGTFYVGVIREEEPAVVEVEPNDSSEAPSWLTLTESAIHSGYASTTLVGALNGEDNFDVFALTTEDVGGQYVSVHLQTGLVGSGLSPRLTVTSDVAGTSLLGGGVVDSTGELSLVDLLVPADAEGLFVTIEAFGRTDAERGNQFFLGLEQYPIPLHD